MLSSVAIVHSHTGARQSLSEKVDPAPSSREEHVVVGGYQLKRAMWDEALRLTQDGMLDLDEARQIWSMVENDGNRMSECERRTIQTIAESCNPSANARQFLDNILCEVGCHVILRFDFREQSTCKCKHSCM